MDFFQVLPEAVHLHAPGEAGQVHEHGRGRVGEQPPLLQTQDDEPRLDKRNVGAGGRLPIGV